MGTQDADGYYPQGSQVEGEGPLGAAQGTPGWLELLDLRFYPAMTARSPARPYIEGTRTDRGFVPSSRQIVY